MQKWLMGIVITSLSFTSFGAEVSLAELLLLKPGQQFSEAKKKLPKLALAGSIKNAEYEIGIEKDLINSIRVDFTLPVDPKNYVSPKASGHCLAQETSPHIPMERKFFFDLPQKKRFELSYDGLIKSILIQDIPGAAVNPKCDFATFAKAKPQAPVIQRIK